ncbi:polyunsaturated fatty acid 5-lipoxygenase-like [Haliotis rubra]|uniref:polyunsaturated fatty acid 5-lipoxygenase-like n=1 Tax=Haliotis rubra TaxID=36100 RepID=UPI001EE50540|nr:polyunsaturated fatty acid 5-lipoxygenase-like [Haliotis rubra]
MLIKLCSEIPKKFAVSDSMIKPFLEGQSVKTALKNNKLFICDLEILKDLVIPNEELTICAPIALFYLDKRNTLVPIAIQLFQERSDDNPVFLPSDDQYTWLLAKLWYNNAEANHHLAVTYIGTACLLTESVGLSMHRHLSISHPLFKMLAPYFTNIMAANSDIMQNLLADEGVVDKVATIGARGSRRSSGNHLSHGALMSTAVSQKTSLKEGCPTSASSPTTTTVTTACCSTTPYRTTSSSTPWYTTLTPTASRTIQNYRTG